MDRCLQVLAEKRIEKTIRNLQKNYMQGFHIHSREELFDKLEELIPAGNSVSFGGSMTLYETGVIDYLRGREDISLIDRDEPGIDRSEVTRRMKAAFTSDVFLASSNAITENGELFNVDGRGNRVAAMIFGPESVVLVVGYNKIVANLDEAELRMKKIAAPANTIRLSCETPCTKTGECMDCSSPARICCTYVTMKQQREQNRIKVLILDESLGF